MAAAAAAAPAAQPPRGGGNGGATQPGTTLYEHFIAVTCKPTRDHCSAQQYKSSSERACRDVLKTAPEKLAGWVAEGYLVACLVPLEYGEENDGAHLETCWVVRSQHQEGKKAVHELVEQRLRPWLKQHTGRTRGSTADNIKWTLRAPHIHDNALLMFGYRFKGSAKCAQPSDFQYVAVGKPDDYLRAAYRAWVTASFTNDEGGDSARKAGRPGQRARPQFTRSSLMPDVELFEHQQRLEGFGFTVGKIAHLMVTEEYATPHPMFVSNSTGTVPASAAAQNLFFQVRKRPRSTTLRAMNQLLYGIGYSDADDAEVERVVAPLREEGMPSFGESQSLTWAQTQAALRTGVLPSGDLIDAQLKGYCARAIVVCLRGTSAALDCVRMMGDLKLLATQQVRAYPTVSATHTLALVARLLATAPQPFGLTIEELGLRCADVSLISHVNEMLSLDAETRDLGPEHMRTFVHSHAPVVMSAAHPWIATGAASNVRLHELCAYADLGSIVRTTLCEFVPGLEQRHVCIVHSPSDDAFFVVAWQLSAAHMASLAAATATGQAQAAGGIAGSSSGVAAGGVAGSSSVAERAAHALARMS
jgi:hypothetical protein